MKRSLLILALVLAACGPAAPSGSVVEQSENGVQTSEFSAALEGRTEAHIRVRAQSEAVMIAALEDSDLLIDAEVQHLGEMSFAEEDGLLELRESIPESVDNSETLQWVVGLTPTIPLNLELMVDSGSVTLDPNGLDLARLALNVGSGSMEIVLPSLDHALIVEVNVESGAINLTMRDPGTLDVHNISIGSGAVHWLIDAPANVTAPMIDIGSGTLSLDVPDDAALRVEVLDVAAGSINLAFPLLRISGGASDEGLWETEGFVNAEPQIALVLQRIGAGTFELE